MADRPDTTKKKMQEAPRLPGFYAVRGIENVVSPVLLKRDAQPAYWTGLAWVILGWDIEVADHPLLVVTKEIHP